jgi:hypothetical protein
MTVIFLFNYIFHLHLCIYGLYFKCKRAEYTGETIMGDKKMDHAACQTRMKSLPAVALRFIADDAQAAIDAMPDGPNAGYYADEVHYAAMEIQKRLVRHVSRECEYQAILSEMWVILTGAGYNSHHMIDDLRELVNDSRRPATEQDEIEAMQ